MNFINKNLQKNFIKTLFNKHFQKKFIKTLFNKIFINLKNQFTFIYFK